MRVLLKSTYKECSIWAANYIVYRINAFRPTKEKPFVLGLPTGSTTLSIYQKLIDIYKKGQISFEHVVVFNMDEYLGLDAKHPQSYAHFMFEHLLNHIDIKKENINLLDGMTKDYAGECKRYEEKMKKYGGVNLFLGGIGSDGHIAFNEPFSSLASRTRVKTLTSSTIKDNSRFFDNDIKKVPQRALTVGVGTMMDADEVMIVASGKHKAKAIQKTIEGSINHMWTASALQMHPHSIIVCDKEAAGELSKKTISYFKDAEKNNY